MSFMVRQIALFVIRIFQSKNKKNKVVHTIKERITFLKLFLMDHNNHNSKLNYFFWQKCQIGNILQHR